MTGPQGWQGTSDWPEHGRAGGGGDLRPAFSASGGGEPHVLLLLKSLWLQGSLLQGLVLWVLLNRQGCHTRGVKTVWGGVSDTLLQLRRKEGKKRWNQSPGNSATSHARLDHGLQWP